MDGFIYAPLAPFLFVLGIVWIKSRNKLEEKRLTLAAQGDAGKAVQATAHHAGRIEELEERVRVLERIVTDRGYDLATQIEALRDARRIDAHLNTLESRERI